MLISHSLFRALVLIFSYLYFFLKQLVDECPSCVVFKYLLVGPAVLLWGRSCWDHSFVFSAAHKFQLGLHVCVSTLCTSFLRKTGCQRVSGSILWVPG